MSEWRETTLGALAEEAGGFIKTGPFGSQLHAYEYTDDPTGIPVVMPKDMVGGRVARATVSRVEEEVAERLKAHRLAPGDVVLARRGDIGRYAFIEDDEDGWLCGTGAMRIHAPNARVIWPRFLRYAMGSPDVAGWLAGQAVGATMPNLNAKIVTELPIRVPSAAVQHRIPAILSAYDDLIEVNERRIELLEDLARSVYREWFVRFRFPGYEAAPMVDSGVLGLIPEGWETGRVDDHVLLARGFDLPLAERSEGRVPVVSASGISGFHSAPKARGPGVSTGRSGTIGRVHYTPSDYWPLNTTLWVQEFRLATPTSAYFLLESLGLESHSSGAAVPTLNRNHIHGLPTVKPPSALVRAFDDVIAPVFAFIQTLKEQNDASRRTRDLLLPRLVTGQLDLSDMDLGDLPTDVEAA